MKKLLSLIAILLLTVTASAEMMFYHFPFVGKWVPAEDPMLISEYGFQDVQNVRKDGQHWKGVGGHTVINTTALSSTYAYIKNGFHFKKEQPAESHVLVHHADAASGNGRVSRNTTAIPNAGNFESSLWHTDGSGADVPGRFSNAPQGNVIYANGVETRIWGGNEMRISAFITSTAAITTTITDPKDCTQFVQNASTTDSATVTTGRLYWVVGTTRPLQGIKFYVGTANASASTLTVKHWDGSGSWASLTPTDNTSVGGKSLAQTGAVTWTSTEATSKQLYLNGYLYYWYQFALSAGEATIYYATADAPVQTIKNIWDGSYNVVGSARKYDGTAYKDDWTDYFNANDPNLPAELNGLTTSQWFVAGFTQPQQGITVKMVAGKENTASATATVSYFNGASFAAVSNANDGTSNGGVSLNKTGTISWQAVAEGSEFPTTIGNEIPLYYYKVSFSANLSGEVKVYNVAGIPATVAIKAFKFPMLYQNRSWLCTETYKDKNKCLYSGYNAPDVWNGSDSGAIYFGDESEVTAAAVVYNVFVNEGQEQLIVTKAKETYRIIGDGPSNWVRQKLSSNIGCVAPRSMAVCEISEVAQEVKRNVAVWMTSWGVVMSDGANIIPISDDIKMYWDQKDSRAIPLARMSASHGWYDPNLRTYKLLIVSGAGQVYRNIELEYSFRTKEWTKIYRENGTGANPIQAAWQVQDTTGNLYTYGGTNEGIMYRLENGLTWAGQPIAEYLHTKDILFERENSLLRHTTARYLRLFFKQKSGTSPSYILTEDSENLTTETSDRLVWDYGENISVYHYGDRVQTVTGVNKQFVPQSFSTSTSPYRTVNCLLGPALLHSFKFESRISGLADGIEPIALGVYYEPQATIGGVQ